MGPHCSPVLLPAPPHYPQSEWDRLRRLVSICLVLQAGRCSIVAAQISQDADTLRFSVSNGGALQRAHTIKHRSEEHKPTLMAGDLFRDSSRVKNEAVAQSVQRQGSSSVSLPLHQTVI